MSSVASRSYAAPAVAGPIHPPRSAAEPTALRLRLHPVTDPARAEVERFVRVVYRRAYGARVPGFAPMLASLADDDGIVAVAGWRSARDILYLERYLDAPVEACIASRLGRDVARSRIAEVGHLAGLRPGAGRRLMLLLGVHLASIGFRWVVSTATPGVRRTLSQAGVQGVALGVATRAAAGPDAEAWGRYYDDGPSVIVGELLPNLARALPRGEPS